MSDVFEYHQGNSPLLLSFPHDGLKIPPELSVVFNDVGNSNYDCDWFISSPYDFIRDLDVSFIKPRYSRYVVDLNRSAGGALLYPGKMETSICPLTTFDGEALYLKGQEPGKSEIESRIDKWWTPYHEHIRKELERIRQMHGHAVLWDAHSIRAIVPQLFDGALPELNFGTADDSSCAKKLIDELINTAWEFSNYSVTLNGRFKGGYITRHYGDPENAVHAIQLEINQDTYLVRSNPPEIDQGKSEQLSQLLQRFVRLLIS